ncbi:MAG: TlyA family RNA methyltransferase [Candidatus Margulisiibacteriota bacterium]
MKKRLDVLLLERGLFDSRAKAQAVIMAGSVLVDGQKIDKSGTLIDEKSTVKILGNRLKYVSRGGLKLEKALGKFGIDPCGRICLDIGASTGGFTDCLLQNGAEKVYAVDVGYGQMDLKVRNDSRVVVIERTNARNLTPEALYGKDDDKSHRASLAVIDVSFISLSKILPAVYGLLSEKAEAAALVKPQFEAGRALVGKGGIVRDNNTHELVLKNAAASAIETGFSFEGSCVSPIKGADGNIEFLIHLKK